MMKIRESNVSKALQRSEIRNMSEACDKQQGINLSQGICDLPLPQGLSDYAKEAMDAGINHYTSHEGLLCLRKAIAQKLRDYNHLDYNPENEIVITSGSTGAFYSACLALLHPQDEVIIFEPFYGYHVYTLQSLDLVPVYVPLQPPTFGFDIQALEKKITNKTKAILINTPANPCGKVFAQRELEQIADVALKYDLYIFTDEIYEYIVYDERKHVSPATIQRIQDRVITISGYSKTFSITGWRIGYCACNSTLAEKIAYASDLVYVCPPAPLQWAVAKAIAQVPPEFYKNLQGHFEQRRNDVCNALANTGLTPYVPEGAYYTLIDVSAVPGATSKEKAMYILEKTEVALVPGSAFYHDAQGENLVRLCFAKEDDILTLACEKMKLLLEDL